MSSDTPSRNTTKEPKCSVPLFCWLLNYYNADYVSNNESSQTNDKPVTNETGKETVDQSDLLGNAV